MAKKTTRKKSYTVNRLCQLTGVDHRIIKKIANEIKPSGKEGRWLVYDLDVVQARLTARRMDAEQDIPKKEQKLDEEIRRLKLANDKEDGKLVEVAIVTATIQAWLSKAPILLRQKLENEYPSKVAGMSVPECRVYGKRLVDEILKGWQEIANEWEA